jgi:hypothetical protein
MYRLGKDVLIGHIGQLLVYDVDVPLAGINENLLGGKQLAETVVGLLQLSAPRPEEIDKLLRKLFAAAWPQATAFTASEYNTIGILFNHIDAF